MASLHSGIQGSAAFSPSKGSLQKVALTKVQSHNSGSSSPKQQDSRKPRSYQSSKTLILQQDKFVEDFGADLGKRTAQRNGTLILPNNTSKEDVQPVTRKLEISEIFAKYTLTTDVPFSGVRTTKAKIEPIKPLEMTPKAINVVKVNEDLTPSPSKQPKLAKTASRLLPPETKTIMETKPSLNNSIRKNRERDSQGTVEKDSLQNSPSKSSFELDAESKEKQAFITEAILAQNIQQEAIDYESFEFMQNNANEANLNHSIHSDERFFDRPNQGLREGMKRLQIAKQTYDPFSVLNQVRTKRQQQEITNRKLEQNRFESRLSSQRNMISDSSKLSTPRDFTVLRSRKVNLFEGIPYVPYDIFLRQDPNMQNVIIKDILKVLLDKAKSLQNFFRDNYRIDKIMKNIEEPEQGALNLHLEETIGLINAIGSLILQEFKDSIDKIGIKPSPIFDNPKLRITGFVNEIERFYDNSDIFLETVEHLRDCVDCYHVMTRQRDRKPIADYDCSNLLQFIARSRYNLGQLFEAFRVIEKHVDGKLVWKAENKKLATQDSSNGRSKSKGDNHKSLNDLLQQKFNINKNKQMTTRESKVVLNQEAEDEKFLNVVQNQKQLKKKGAHEIGDSRKLIILNRILNPLEDPEIQLAIKVAKEKTNVQISKDLLESIGSRTRSVDHKTKPNMELPLIKSTMQKILSNKKITNMCFDLEDPKKYVESLTARNKNTEDQDVVKELFNHSKSHKHLGCLFDKEVIKESQKQEGVKLPKLQRPKKIATKTR